MNTEDYVSFELAKLLKEKGFDVPIWTRYESSNEVIFGDKYNWNDSSKGQISAPTHQMAMKWLREVHKIYIDISTTYSEEEKTMHYIWQIFNSEYDGIGDCEIFYGKYEDACETSIKYCLENLENLRSTY